MIKRHFAHTLQFAAAAPPAPLESQITPPKVEAGGGTGGGGGGDPAAIDIENYVPPATATIDFGDGTEHTPAPPKTDPAPAPKPAPTEPPKETPPKTDPPAPKPAALPDDAGPRQLRERLREIETQTAAKIADLETQLASARSDTRIEELTKKIQDAEGTRAAIAAEKDKLNNQLLIHNPLVAKPLRELRDAFNAEYQDTLETVPTLGPVYNSLLDEFSALPRGTDDYPEKLGAYRAKLKEAFGDDHGLVFDAMRKGFKFRADHARIAQDVQRDASKLHHTAVREDWTKKHESFEKEFPTYFEPPADAADKDPLNTLLFLKNFEEGLEPAEVEKVNGNVKKYVDRVLHGAQPRTREDFPELDEAAAEREMARINANVDEDRARARRLFSQGLKFLMYARPIVAALIEQGQVSKKKAASLPPDPTRQPGSTGSGADGALDLENYVPPAIDNAAFT